MSKKLIAFANGTQNVLKTVHHFSECTSEPCFLKEMWIFISPCKLITSIQNPVSCEACFILQQHSAKNGRADAASRCSSHSRNAF
jgi:hypothetical protein